MFKGRIAEVPTLILSKFTKPAFHVLGVRDLLGFLIIGPIEDSLGVLMAYGFI